MKKKLVVVDLGLMNGRLGEFLFVDGVSGGADDSVGCYDVAVAEAKAIKGISVVRFGKEDGNDVVDELCKRTLKEVAVVVVAVAALLVDNLSLVECWRKEVVVVLVDEWGAPLFSEAWHILLYERRRPLLLRQQFEKKKRRRRRKSYSEAYS